MLSEKSLNITTREIEIIDAISLGFSSSEISNLLFISTFTVNTHRRNVMSKMKVRSSAHLIRKSFELGFIELSLS